MDEKREFDSGLESIENAPKSGRSKSASCDEFISEVKEFVERDARYTVRDIPRMVGISLSRVHYILKNTLNVRKISSGGCLIFLTGGQKKQRVKIAKQLLKIFTIYNGKKFANVVTGDETWVHYLDLLV